MEESHTKEQFPKTVLETELRAKRSKNHVWEQEHGGESCWIFLLEEEEDVGAKG